MKKLIRYIPSILFNTFELLLLFSIGYLLKVNIFNIICILLTFMLTRNIVGKGKHYKSPIFCLIWSSLVFIALFLISRVNHCLAMLLTIYYAVTQTEKVDTSELFMWKGKSSNYSYIKEFITKKEGTVALQNFEDKLKATDLKAYKIYLYKFKYGYSFTTISELMNIDNRRISEILKSLELAINLYFEIK